MPAEKEKKMLPASSEVVTLYETTELLENRFGEVLQLLDALAPLSGVEGTGSIYRDADIDRFFHELSPDTWIRVNRCNVFAKIDPMTNRLIVGQNEENGDPTTDVLASPFTWDIGKIEGQVQGRQISRWIISVSKRLRQDSSKKSLTDNFETRASSFFITRIVLKGGACFHRVHENRYINGTLMVSREWEGNSPGARFFSNAISHAELCERLGRLQEELAAIQALNQPQSSMAALTS